MPGRGDVCSQGERVHPVSEILHCTTFDDPDLNSISNSLYFHLHLCHDSLLGLLLAVWDVFLHLLFCYLCLRTSCSFPSPTIRMLCRTACRTLTWNGIHLSLTAETPSWSPVTAPVTPAARRVPCALCHDRLMLIVGKLICISASEVLFVKLTALNIRPDAR